MYTHEDERRILVEILGGNVTIKEVKLIETKKECSLGDHYHLKKDEYFYLLGGSGTVTLGNWDDPTTDKTEEAQLGKLYVVPRGIYHEFKLMGGSKLLGLCTEPFDREDEITRK